MNDTEKLRLVDDYHRDRIAKLRGNETLVPLYDSGRIVFHLIPENSIDLGTDYDLTVFGDNPRILRTLRDRAYGLTYVQEGLLGFIERDRQLGYTLIARNGAIEAIDASYCYFVKDDKEKFLPVFSIEEGIRDSAVEYLALLKNLGVRLPIYLYLNFLNVKGFRIGGPVNFNLDNIHPIFTDDLEFHRLRIDDYDVSVEKVLKTWFDRLWNAGGYPVSLHYDEKGNWVKK